MVEIGLLKEKRYYTVEQAARLLGISKQTLIRYEKKLIFPKANRNALNGWREYTDEGIDMLRRIMGRGAEQT
jgi:DNA-binding transcriptional MerR regulator